VRYAFVAEHCVQFSVWAMCRRLRIQPSGFWATQKAPSGKRVQEDRRETELIFKAPDDGGKVYGYRKLHHDRLDPGDSICQTGWRD
jgi:putative transposase